MRGEQRAARDGGRLGRPAREAGGLGHSRVLGQVAQRAAQGLVGDGEPALGTRSDDE